MRPVVTHMPLASADWQRRACNVCYLSPKAARRLGLIYSSSAEHFNVSLPFLSQQAALLYERQLSQVRAGLQKANRLSSGASPTPGSISGSGTAGGYVMTRGGSGGTGQSMCSLAFTYPVSGSRVPSSLSHRAKERTTSHGENSTEFQRQGRRMFLFLSLHQRDSLRYQVQCLERPQPTLSHKSLRRHERLRKGIIPLPSELGVAKL